MFGSDPVQNCSELARLDSKTSFGSDLVKVWRGWAHLHVRCGSELVQIWFRFESDLAQCWFSFGSVGRNGGSDSDQYWLRFVSAWTEGQLRFRIGSGLARLG